MASRPPISWLIYGTALLAAFAVAPVLFPNPYFRTVMGDLVPLLVIAAAFVFSLRNCLDSHGHTRFFWALMAASMAMWCLNQAGWAWFEVFARKPIPDPYEGDIILFLHLVPLMAAVAIRPHQADEGEGILPSTLNVLILLVWWVVVYAFFVFPEEYLVTNLPVYNLRWDFFYLLEGLILIAVSASAYFASTGPWRQLYRNIFIASALYTFSSEALNIVIFRGNYRSGGIYDLPLLASALGFLAVSLYGRHSLSGIQMTPSLRRPNRAIAPQLAVLALLSLPVMAYWALFLSQDPPFLRQVRFAVAMFGVASMAFVVFLKQHLLDQRLLHLLKHSRKSFDNLQRLQGRVVQQAKLASLGELVALAAGELEFPLSAILSSSERMAASSNLNREQLANAQKIGQQARRTRALVSDLLSFAQQTPGDKAPLELKPLLQRAVQMEGFKLENKKISLTVETGSGPIPRVVGNSNQLLQAFLQIVENAVDALQEIGGGRLQVSVWREDDQAVVQFADSGPGLRDPERVFDPFYTTKAVGKGTGLGLSATYGVVQDHKGQITCYNRPEGGAVFEIRLPVLRVNAPMMEAEHV